MGLILDSSVLIAAERKRFDLNAFIEAEAAMMPIFLSCITVSELLHGVHRAKPEYRNRREGYVEAMLENTPSLPMDLPCARRHAELWATLEMEGVRIGAHDMLIAATCLRYGHRLATLNESEFKRVGGLELANTQPYVLTPWPWKRHRLRSHSEMISADGSLPNSHRCRGRPCGEG